MKNKRWKAGEMEIAINLKAMRCGWIFLILSLSAWCLVDAISTGEFLTVPFVLEGVSVILFFIVKLVMTNRMIKQENDDDEE